MDWVFEGAGGPSGGFELFLNCCPNLARGSRNGKSTPLWTIERCFGRQWCELITSNKQDIGTQENLENFFTRVYTQGQKQNPID
jgi:hypothetical protein